MADPVKQKRPRGLPPGPPFTLRCDADETHHLKLALANMLDSYYRLLETLPRKTMAHGMVVEAFGKTPALAEGLCDNYMRQINVRTRNSAP